MTYEAQAPDAEALECVGCLRVRDDVRIWLNLGTGSASAARLCISCRRNNPRWRNYTAVPQGTGWMTFGDIGPVSPAGALHYAGKSVRGFLTPLYFPYHQLFCIDVYGDGVVVEIVVRETGQRRDILGEINDELLPARCVPDVLEFHVGGEVKCAHAMSNASMHLSARASSSYAPCHYNLYQVPASANDPRCPRCGAWVRPNWDNAP